MPLGIPPLQLFNAATSVLFVVLGVLVARVRGGGAQNRAFAAHAIGLGAAFFIINVWNRGAIFRPANAVETVTIAIAIALFIVSGIFLVALVRHLAPPLAPREHVPAWPFVLGVLFCAMQAPAVVAGGLDPAAGPVAGWVGIASVLGYRVGLAAFWTAIALAAARFKGAQGGDPSAQARLALVSSAVVLWPAYGAGLSVINNAATWDLAGLSWLSSVLVPLAIAAFWLNAARRAEPPAARSARTVAWALLGAMLAGMVVYAVTGQNDNVGYGIARLAAIAILAYVIVKHQLLGIDVKIRWGISKTTVAAAFIAVFFVASEAAQQFFGATFGGAYVGIAAAGALVFGLAPLQRAAERLAERAVPVAAPALPAPIPAPSSRAEVVYKAALRAALRDGTLTRREERHLAEIVRELAIDPVQAHDWRDDVEREARGEPA